MAEREAAMLLAKPGDSVKAGDPLFRMLLVSEFVQSTQNELAKSAQELRIATAKRDRTSAPTAKASFPSLRS